jgi:uncharacterized protein YutE (UPF0331/DUF86 family)
MSRQEDFEKAAEDYCEDHSHCIYFEFGAEYGYQYAVDKVCDILNHYCNRTGVHPSRRVDIINHIRKAMEE